MAGAKMKSGKPDTRTHILDVAERHFGIYGFMGTSLRGIIKEAKVNVAAVAYHFGSKEILFSEVMQRFAIPVVHGQLEKLRTTMSGPTVRLQDILNAFYEPPIVLIKGLGERGETLSLFLGRAQTEPDPVFSMVDEHYAACRNEFIDAFRTVIPDLSEADYQWHFEFMLSLIVCFLTRKRPIMERYSTSVDWQPDEVVARLTTFCAAGMQEKL
jgi:AcrR family transcriptional regulator